MNYPYAPSRISLYAKARKTRDLAQIAMESAIDGPECNIRRACDLLDEIRGILGASDNASSGAQP